MHRIGGDILIAFLYRIRNSFRVRFRTAVYLPYLRKTFGKCGQKVIIGDGERIAGNQNIFFGDDVYVGPDALLYTTKAKLIFGNHITIGPRLTVITGDHRIDVVGEHISCLSDDEKLPENDADVTIEDGVWIGVNVNIFKGVTIGRGSVIAGGATVTKDVPPYSIYISRDKILRRFTDEQIAEHERLLKEKYEK